MVKDAHTSGKKAFALSFHGSRSIFLRLVSAYLKSLLNRSRTILWYLNGEIITDNRQTLIHKSSPTTTTAFVPGPLERHSANWPTDTKRSGVDPSHFGKLPLCGLHHGISISLLRVSISLFYYSLRLLEISLFFTMCKEIRLVLVVRLGENRPFTTERK